MINLAGLPRNLEIDGTLASGHFSLPPACWKPESRDRDFSLSFFIDDFDVEQQRALRKKHLKLLLRKGNTHLDTIQFNFSSQPGPSTRLAYRLAINEYIGAETLQLMVHDHE